MDVGGSSNILFGRPHESSSAAITYISTCFRGSKQLYVQLFISSPTIAFLLPVTGFLLINYTTAQLVVRFRGAAPVWIQSLLWLLMFPGVSFFLYFHLKSNLFHLLFTSGTLTQHHATPVMDDSQEVVHSSRSKIKLWLAKKLHIHIFTHMFHVHTCLLFKFNLYNITWESPSFCWVMIGVWVSFV